MINVKLKAKNLFLSVIGTMLLTMNALASTKYDDNISKWSIYVNSSGTATVTNVYDATHNSNVIKFSGDGLNDGFKIGNTRGTSRWNNTQEKVLTWSMNYSENVAIYIALKTPNGSRYLKYTNSDNDNGLSRGYIHHGLGSNITDGTWRTFTRNLEADLQEFDPSNSITAIDAFFIRGSGKIVDIELSNPYITSYNKNYNSKMLLSSQPTQESPWGFQEISLQGGVTEHNVSTIQEYKKVISKWRKDGLPNNELQWKDNRVHIIHFMEGNYTIDNSYTNNRYYVFLVPSKTIIEGAGIGKTVFNISKEINISTSLFTTEFATHDVVIRGLSFYNKTKNNKWNLINSNGARDRENYLFENIEFDDSFGNIGKERYTSNFITFRGLRKRIGNTTERIKKFYSLPVPLNYQFSSQNSANVKLAGQIGVRDGNSIVFHDCLLGDNISATIDLYSNSVEMVGVKFVNPLHDHAIKSPRGNHIYIHDSSFELNYEKKLMEGSGYWNPTFFTHEITNGDKISLRKNYHFKNLKFKRKFKNILVEKNGTVTSYCESEPFTIYDEREKRKNNVSGDMVWENISFEGYSEEHQVVGYPNVQTAEGYEALNYTNYDALSAQMKADNNNSHGSYSVGIEPKYGTSKLDTTGVYSWGNKRDGRIDYARDNRLFIGYKQEAINQPYIKMFSSSVKEIYNSKINATIP